jgi:hypothetical protein
MNRLYVHFRDNTKAAIDGGKEAILAMHGWECNCGVAVSLR